MSVAPKAKSPTKRESKMISDFEKAMGSDCVESLFLRERSIMFTVKPSAMLKAVEFMKEKWGLYHCSTITGMDLEGGKLAVIYHFEAQGVTVNVKEVVPTAKPVADSIVALIPGAEFYEREVFDMIGVEFKGHPDLRRLVLPEDFPKGVHPLRKSWKSPRADK
ncbi:MAG: NADH-quinone oxidoreductase subunit C [Promethearchaeota archaeon]